MADIEITATTMVVHIRGADRLFALASRLEVPLKHIDPNATADAISSALARSSS